MPTASMPRRRSGSMTDEDRAEYREQQRQRADALLDALLTQEGWSGWLRLRRNLHSYSWANQALIAAGASEQAALARAGDPAAPVTPCAAMPTLVKGASAWKRDGYHPARGTRGLSIWAYRSRRRRDGSWSCCGARLTGDRCGECGRSDHYFAVVPVFDASQVRSFGTGEAPPPRPDARVPVEGDDPGSELLPVLHRWALAEGIAATVDLDCDDRRGEGGSWTPRTRALRVCRRISGVERSANSRLRTMIHELAHALGITSLATGSTLTYADAEVAVECVSYVVAGTVGLDTSGEAVPYMAGWGGERARTLVRELAPLIDAAAKRIEAPLLVALETAAA